MAPHSIQRTAEPNDAAGPEVLIDLGELHNPGEPAQPPRRPRWSRVPLPVAVAVLGLLAVGTQTAAAGPAGLLPAYTLDADSISAQADDASVYVIAGLTPTLTAYRVGDGGVRWRRDVPVGRSTRVEPTGDGPLLVTVTCAEGANTQVTRLDGTTGAPGWSAWGAPVGPAPGGRLLLARRPPTCPDDPAGTGMPGSLDAVDARTGRVAWSIPIRPDDRGTVSATEDDVRRLVLVHVDGTVELWDTTTGTRLVSTRIAALAAPPPWHVESGVGTNAEGGMVLAGDLLLLTTLAGEDAVLRGYRLDAHAERWEYRTNRDAFPGAYAVTPCGALVCLLGEHRTTALDSATGRRMWQSDTSMLVEGYGRVLGEDAHALRLLDAATGASVAGWPSWHRLPALGRGRGALLAVRAAAGGTQVAEVDPVAGTLRPLGAVSGGLTACELRVGRLLCTTPAGNVRAWRVVK